MGEDSLLKIGLTGGIATGKSTVAKMLEQLGVPVFDADKEAHLLLAKDGAACRAVKEKFVDELGFDILANDGGIDRKKLGSIVFSNRELLSFLEHTMHVKIREKMQAFIDQKEEAGYPAVILDIPLLIEKDWQDKLDLIWLVYVPCQLQKERLKLRDGITDEEVEKRLAVQMPIEDKRKYADVLLDNSGTQEQTRKMVETAWKDII